MPVCLHKKVDNMENVKISRGGKHMFTSFRKKKYFSGL